jgi:aldehyde dehydrogenase (NAD+)
MIIYDKLLIGGKWLVPVGSGVFEVRSPHDQALIGRTPEATEGDVDRAVAAAREAFDRGPWPRLAPERRQEFVERFNKLHSARSDEISALVTSENGSALWFTRGWQPRQADRINDSVAIARDYPWEDVIVDPQGQQTLVRQEPVGVVAAVIPWNSPQGAALVKLIPALLAGCPVILKPAPETALDGVLLGEIFAEAGFPDGVVSVLPADRAVSEYLISHPGIDKIAFTGSTAAGRRIGSIAAEQIKRVSLELGGKSAAIVLEDADLDAMAAGLKSATFGNNGEACVAHTRVLAPRGRYDEVVTAIATMVAGLKVGNPLDPDTFIGPMVSAAQQQRVRAYINLGIEEGARVVVGGPGAPEGPDLARGFYVRPTVFADVDNSDRPGRDLRPCRRRDPLRRRGGCAPDRQRLSLRPQRRCLDRRPAPRSRDRQGGPHRLVHDQRRTAQHERTVRRVQGQRVRA